MSKRRTSDAVGTTGELKNNSRPAALGRFSPVLSAADKLKLETEAREIARNATVIPKDVYAVLAANRDLVIGLLNGVAQAFSDASAAENDRERFVTALVCIAKFFGKDGLRTPFAGRFFELAMAMADLDRGTTGPLLKAPAKGSGKPPQAWEIWTARARVLLALEALSRCEQHRSKVTAAAKDIAKRFPDVHKLVDAKRPKRLLRGNAVPLWESILEWRKKFPPENNWQVTEFYQVGLGIVAARDRQGLIEFANEQLATAVKFTRDAELLRKPSARSNVEKRPKRNVDVKHDAKGRFEY